MPYSPPKAPTLPFWRNFGNGGQVGAVGAQTVWSVFPLDYIDFDAFNGYITAKTMGIFVSYSTTQTSVSTRFTSSYFGALYTLNGSSLSLLNSFSATWGASTDSTANTSLWNGIKVLTVHSSQWSVEPTFIASEQYWMALQCSTNNTSVGFSIVTPVNSALTGWSGSIGGGSSNISNVIPGLFHGVYTASTVVPTTIDQSQIQGNSTLINITPCLRFDGSIPQQYF